MEIVHRISQIINSKIYSKHDSVLPYTRSGSEGFYPDLLEFTEKKLQEINPKRFASKLLCLHISLFFSLYFSFFVFSDVLRRDKPARIVKDLDADDKKMVTEDLLVIRFCFLS